MKAKIRFIIVSPITGLYYTGNKLTSMAETMEPDWTMYINKLKKNVLFETYEAAQAKIELLTTGYYQIEKIFKV